MSLRGKIQGSEDPINEYIRKHSLRFTTEQLELMEYTKSLPGSHESFDFFSANNVDCINFTIAHLSRMLCSLDEAQFFQVLVRLMDCKRCIEIGTFTGYTSLTIALVLPPDGQLITCDIDDQYVRQDLWSKAGVRDKISLRIGPAIATLEKLIEEHNDGLFDFIFLDADKVNYLRHYELSIQLLRSNGLHVIDNTLWSGRVIDQNDKGAITVAIRETNNFIKNDERIDISFLRIADGVTLCRKK
ncbi:unnamed protein product [Rotaria sp. Silwood2]|nr:unnamed protein product [Rotaria sp. Silwood2]